MLDIFGPVYVPGPNILLQASLTGKVAGNLVCHTALHSFQCSFAPIPVAMIPLFVCMCIPVVGSKNVTACIRLYE